MSNRARIDFISKTNRLNPHERITHVGGNSPTPWIITQERAIALIESGWHFYTSISGKTVSVVIALSGFGNKYLRTESDGDFSNNLLSLPEAR